MHNVKKIQCQMQSDKMHMIKMHTAQMQNAIFLAHFKNYRKQSTGQMHVLKLNRAPRTGASRRIELAGLDTK